MIKLTEEEEKDFIKLPKGDLAKEYMKRDDTNSILLGWDIMRLSILRTEQTKEKETVSNILNRQIKTIKVAGPLD